MPAQCHFYSVYFISKDPQLDDIGDRVYRRALYTAEDIRPEYEKTLLSNFIPLSWCTPNSLEQIKEEAQSVYNEYSVIFKAAISKTETEKLLQLDRSHKRQSQRENTAAIERHLQSSKCIKVFKRRLHFLHKETGRMVPKRKKIQSSSELYLTRWTP